MIFCRWKSWTSLKRGFIGARTKVLGFDFEHHVRSQMTHEQALTAWENLRHTLTHSLRHYKISTFEISTLAHPLPLVHPSKTPQPNYVSSTPSWHALQNTPPFIASYPFRIKHAHQLTHYTKVPLRTARLMLSQTHPIQTTYQVLLVYHCSIITQACNCPGQKQWCVPREEMWIVRLSMVVSHATSCHVIRRLILSFFHIASAMKVVS
jgi:hypothetical protein